MKISRFLLGKFPIAYLDRHLSCLPGNSWKGRASFGLALKQQEMNFLCSSK